MRFGSVILAALLATTGTVALAHGDQKHVVGTIEKISADIVVVKTAAGKSVEVKLVSKTVYTHKDGKSAQFSNLAVGDRVVIHATPRGETLEANEVKFAKPGSPASAPKQNTHP